MTCHTFSDSITKNKPGLPLFILFVISFILIIIKYFDYKRTLFSSDIKEFLKAEPIKENFFSIISKPDKIWYLLENKFLH